MPKFPTRPLWLIACCMAEVLLTISLTLAWGGTRTFSLILLLTLVGVWVQWLRLPAFKANLPVMKAVQERAKIVETGDAEVDCAAHRAAQEEIRRDPAAMRAVRFEMCYVATLILLLVPGLLSRALAFALMLPAVQAKFIR